MSHFAYILKSLKDNKYYYGSSEDLHKRVETHNNRKVKATKNRRPFIIHYFEEYQTRSETSKREKFFKSIDGYKWLKEHGIT